MTQQKATKFLTTLGAAGLFMLALWLVPHTPDPIILFLQKITGHAVLIVAHLLGLSAHYNPETQLFGVAGFDMLLVAECVALHYFAILWLSIVLMPRQGWKRKVYGWFCCTAVLFGANVLRLIFLGIVGYNFPRQFEMMHDVVWQVVFAIITFSLCFAWTKKVTNKVRSFSGLVFFSLFLSTGFALILNACKAYYLAGMVWFADKTLLLIQDVIPFGSRWREINSGTFTIVRLQGERILYQVPGGKEFTVNFWQDFLGIALFWGFCSCSLLLAIWRRERGCSLAGTLIGFVFGTLLVLLLQLGSLVILGGLLINQADMNFVKNFLWLMRGLSVFVPILCWWLFWKSSVFKKSYHEGPLKLGVPAGSCG